jgi:uncharacterized coiled-coil protein SlyX
MPDEEIVVETPTEESQEVSLEEAGLAVEKEEIADPGQMEGKRPPEEVRHDPFEKRVSKVVARLKGAEETIERLKSKEASNEAVMSEVRKHNAALMEKLEALSNKAIEAVETTRQPAGDPPEIVNIRQAIADLESRKEEAVENLKGKEVVQIDRELHKLERIVEGYEYHKQKEATEKTREKAQPKPPVQQPDIDPILDEFTKDNDWFNKDPIMTGAALEYDRFLLAKPEWKGKPDKERFRQVRADIESRFNTKPEAKPKPVGAESGIGLQRPSGSLSSKTVKLSSEEMAVAQGLGITPESYAKQKNFLGGAV